MVDLEHILIFDAGSGFTKAGWNRGEGVPRGVYPTIIGTTRNSPTKAYVGDEAWAKRAQLNMSRPIDRGVVVNWEGMDQLMHHTFYNELRVAPEEQAMLFCDVVNSTQRARIAQLLFETHELAALSFISTSSLAFSACYETRLVVDIGHGVTQIVPMQKLKPIRNAIVQLSIGGGDVTRQLEKLLTPDCSKLSADQLSSVKESYAHVSMQFEKDLATASAQKPQVFTQVESESGGEVRVLSSLLFRCGEVLFQPAQAGIECLSLHEAIHESLSKCEPAVRKQLYTNIVLAGGGSLLKGLPERLIKELLAVSAPEHHEAIQKLRYPPERKFSSYFGANDFVSMSSFGRDHVFSRDEYREEGAARLIARKCMN